MFIKDFNLMIIWAQWPVAEATGRFASILAVPVNAFTLDDTDSQEATDTGDQRSQQR